MTLSGTRGWVRFYFALRDVGVALCDQQLAGGLIIILPYSMTNARRLQDSCCDVVLHC